MKKKILGLVVVSAIACTAAWNINRGNTTNVISDLALNNIEAFADSESSGEFTENTGCVACICDSKCKSHKNAYHPS